MKNWLLILVLSGILAWGIACGGGSSDTARPGSSGDDDDDDDVTSPTGDDDTSGDDDDDNDDTTPDDDDTTPDDDDDDDTTPDDDDDDNDSSPVQDCFIDGSWWADGETNPANICLICDSQASDNSWTYNDGAACEDDVYCNGADTCLSGLCSEHAGDPCQDDGLFCNGAEFCDFQTDECTHQGTPCPDDNFFCTGVESCDETADQCASTGDPCDDGLFCTGSEVCDEVNNDCSAGTAPCTDDGAFCNGEEECLEASDQCTSSGDPCGDELFCNGEEICNETDDQCDSLGDPCLDTLWCNGTETCNETTDECVEGQEQCFDDGIWCNGTELCDEAADECMTASEPCPDNGMWCDGEEICFEDTETCGKTGNPCLDELYCNGEERCYEASHTCASPGNPCLDDLWCNGDETCIESTDTCGAGTAQCVDDGLWCNGAESCSESNNECVIPVDPCPDDMLFCTGDETCDEGTDTCGHTGDPCEPDEVCNDGRDECGAGCYPDRDLDGFGDENASAVWFPDDTCDTGYVLDNTDCNDSLAGINPDGMDLPDDNSDQDCSGSDFTHSNANGIFVSVNGTVGNPGTMAQPMLLLQDGIDAAEAQGKSVFIAQGEYVGGFTTTASLYGGYDDAAWTRNITANNTWIVGENGPAVTIAAAKAGETVLNGLILLPPKELSSMAYGLVVEPDGNAWLAAVQFSQVSMTGTELTQLYAQDALVVAKEVTIGVPATATSRGVVIDGGSADFSHLLLNPAGGATESVGFVIQDATVEIAISEIKGGSLAPLCQAVSVQGTSQVIITRSVLTGGDDQCDVTVGLAVDSGTVRLANNVISGGEGADLSTGLEAAGGSVWAVNNVLLGGGSTTEARAVYGDSTLYLINNVIDGGDIAAAVGIVVGGAGAVELLNNDVWSASSANLLDDGTEVVTTAAGLNACGWDGCAAAGDNLRANPGFVDRANDDFHITNAGPCYETGIDPHPWWDSLFIEIDLDLEFRPVGDTWEIGLDEVE